jgi:hypothetical protein
MHATLADQRPSTAARPSQDPEWILATPAAQVLGCHRHLLPGLAARGLIRRRTIPGAAPRYSRSDCEELARRSTTPAAALETIGAGDDPQQQR